MRRETLCHLKTSTSRPECYLWQGALLFALLDAPLLLLLAWRIDKELFRRSRGALVTITGVAWFGIWS